MDNTLEFLHKILQLQKHYILSGDGKQYSYIKLLDILELYESKHDQPTVNHYLDSDVGC